MSYAVGLADGLGINPTADPEKIRLAILIFRQVAKPSLCQGTHRGIIDSVLGGHYTHDRFHMHQTHLEYMVFFSQRRASNPGPPVSTDQAITVHTVDGMMVPLSLFYFISFLFLSFFFFFFFKKIKEKTR